MSANDELHVRQDRGPYPDTLGTLSVPLILTTAQRMDGRATANVHPGATAIYALLDECTRREKWVNPDDVNGEDFVLAENTEVETRLRARSLPKYAVEQSRQLAVLLLAECVDVGGIAPAAFAEEGAGPGWFIMALEYDYFGPGYTAYRPISQEDVRVLYRFYQRDTEHGRDAWLAYWHRAEPWSRVKERIESGGKWNVAELVAGTLPPDLQAELELTKLGDRT